jgi:peptidyl-prolyl cis-trans isomerase B (cyclophilin B)
MAYPQPPPGNQPGNQWWGQPPQSSPGVYPPMYPVPRQTNAMAIAALVSAFVVAPLGIVFGHIALSQLKRNDEDGRGLAIAGLVIGYVFTGMFVVLFVIWIAMMAWVVNEMDNLPSMQTTYGTYTMHSTLITESTGLPTPA